MTISREIIAERRPFKTPIYFGKSNATSELPTKANPGHKHTPSGRRPFKTLIKLEDIEDGCNQWVTHRYYSATGVEIWRADHGSIVRAIAVDASGNVYTAGGLSSNPEHYKLQKWNSAGKRQWGVLVDSRAGYDVDVDSSGNIWLAAGDVLQKYSTSGALLLTVSPVADPFMYNNDGVTFHTRYFTDVKRVSVSPNDLVVFGPSTTTLDLRTTSPIPTPPGVPWLGGNTCHVDGSNVNVFYSSDLWLRGYTLPDEHNLIQSRIDFDDEGNFYQGQIAYVAGSQPGADSGFALYMQAVSESAFVGGFRPSGDPKMHAQTGSGQASMAVVAATVANLEREAGVAALAVHRPTGSVLFSWGRDGVGEIKEVATLVPTHGLPYLESQTTLVSDADSGHNGVLSVNDNHRYVYGVDAVGATIRVRDYPDTFRWQADHKTEVYDAIIKADNTVLIGGNRVFDDCVPVGLAAAAGCTNTGIVTVYEIDGTVRWSKTLLTSTSVNHDICFDSVGGIWARSGDGRQLVHTDLTGTILSDEAIGSIYSGGSPPSIDFGPDGVCYSNQLSVAGVETPTVLATGPSGDLLSTPFNTGVVSSIGVTAAGKIVGWSGASYWIWDTDGTLLFTGNLPAVGITASFRAAALSPTGDYLHVYKYSTFYSSVYTGTINLNTGVAGGGTDTLLSNVTAAWCTPTGTPVYGATSLNILHGSTFPSTIAKISGGPNRIVVAAVGKLELWTNALGSYSRNWTKSVNSVSCDYFKG